MLTVVGTSKAAAALPLDVIACNGVVVKTDCELRLDLNPLGCSESVIITWKEY